MTRYQNQEAASKPRKRQRLTSERCLQSGPLSTELFAQKAIPHSRTYAANNLGERVGVRGQKKHRPFRAERDLLGTDPTH
jgi:hypothetical protein